MTRVGYGEWRMSGSSPLASGLQVVPSVKSVSLFFNGCTPPFLFTYHQLIHFFN
jgi:hypothetical protein